MTNNEITLQRNADAMVSREVHLCLSSMVAALASGAHTVPHRDHDDTALFDLTQQASELCAPGLDYEEAARQAGWRDDPLKSGRWMRDQPNHLPGIFNYADTAEEACELDALDPYEWEVFEHWAVTPWLADKLADRGQRVDTDFAGLNVWARTCTGQAISMDSVIRAIVTELHA